MAAKLNSGFSVVLGLVSFGAGLVGLTGIFFWMYEVSKGKEAFDFKAFVIVVLVVLILLAIGGALLRNGFRENTKEK